MRNATTVCTHRCLRGANCGGCGCTGCGYGQSALDAAERLDPQTATGLRVNIYRSAKYEGTAPDAVTVIGVNRSWTAAHDPLEDAAPLPRDCQVFAATADAPAAVLNIRDNGTVRFVSVLPARVPPDGRTPWMDGGTVASSYDSRWRELTGGAEARYHNRAETWENYEYLTR